MGPTRETDLARGIDRYLKRLRHYAEVTVDVAPEAKGRRDEYVAQQEGAELLRRLAKRGRLVGLDPGGEAHTSDGFARALEIALTAGGGQVQFVLGGPTGLSPEVRERLHGLVSLTPMTLTHEMARLLLVEQLYRAGTILRGEPYHKG